MKDHAHADVIEFISAVHQIAMQTDFDEVDDSSRLTKGDQEAPDYTDAVSPLASMGTTESKAARAADARELIVTKQLTETYHAKLEERDNKISDFLTERMNSMAGFARMLESFTPDQLQKLTGASNEQMKLIHAAVVFTESEDDKVDNTDEDEDGATNSNMDSTSDNSNGDQLEEIMQENCDNPDGDVLGDMTDDKGTLNNPIEMYSDAGDDKDMDEHRTGASFSLSRVAGSPPRKQTALMEKVKLLGTTGGGGF